MKHNTDLVIITREPFPLGMAATNRMLSYANEIAKKKQVNLIITQPTELEGNIRNSKTEGIYQQIHFKYLHNTTVWPQESPKYIKAKLLFESYIRLKKELATLKPISVLLISNDIYLIWYVWFLSKILSFNYFQEKSEKPPVLKKPTNPIYQKFYLFSYRLFSGMIVMTKELETLFLSLKQKTLYVLPMTVDILRFNIEKKERRISKSKYIFKYCSGGAYERDGLLNTVLGFIELRKFTSEFEFHIIGPLNNNSEYFKEVERVVIENNIDNYIKFIGPVNSDKIPTLLSEADCLILTPAKDYDSGGFPTKLGEYLATGKPVVCTGVSEIPLYLNKENSILIEPNNQDELVIALRDVINNPEDKIKIGKKGRLVAENYFTMNTHTNQLIKFLKL